MIHKDKIRNTHDQRLHISPISNHAIQCSLCMYVYVVEVGMWLDMVPWLEHLD